MPAETETGPWQKTIDFVDGLGGDSLDELLANFEFARVKEYVEKRSREAAQAQVTVTPDDTYITVAPARLIPTCRQMYVLGWRVARVRWARS